MRPSDFIPVPANQVQAALLFLVSPLLFGLFSAGASLLISSLLLTNERFLMLQPEIYTLASWLGASGAVGGALFAWVGLMRYRHGTPVAEPKPSEAERLQAAVGAADESGES